MRRTANRSARPTTGSEGRAGGSKTKPVMTPVIGRDGPPRQRLKPTEPPTGYGVCRLGILFHKAKLPGDRIMATSKARDDIKKDLKTLKEDLKVGARRSEERRGGRGRSHRCRRERGQSRRQ